MAVDILDNILKQKLIPCNTYYLKSDIKYLVMTYVGLNLLIHCAITGCRNISIEKNCKCGRRARNLRHLFRSSKRLHPYNNTSKYQFLWIFLLLKISNNSFLISFLFIHPILPSCSLSASSSSFWFDFLELSKIFSTSTSYSWLSSAFLRKKSTSSFYQ